MTLEGAIFMLKNKNLKTWGIVHNAILLRVNSGFTDMMKNKCSLKNN
jgi:hypothetical protein